MGGAKTSEAAAEGDAEKASGDGSTEVSVEDIWREDPSEWIAPADFPTVSSCEAPRRLTVEQRLALVRAAHHDYVDALHAGDPEEIEAARERLRAEYDAARALVERHAAVLRATYEQVLDPDDDPFDALFDGFQRVNGALTRITGDETHAEAR